MNVRDLLAVDESSSPLAIREVLGDGFLVEHNSVYRSVRSSATEFGFRYLTEAGTELWSDYQLMSLACLEQLMTTKLIPCYPTKRILNKLNEKHFLDDPLPFQFLLMTLAANNHFHESSHAVGYRALSECSDLVNALSQSDNEARVWGSIITEAVANTVEYVAWMISGSSVERVFLRLNAPSSYEDADLRTFAQYVIATFGLFFLFEHVLYSFLLGRLYADVTDPRRQSDLNSIFEDEKYSDTSGKVAAILLRTAKGLRADFREVVAPSYFALIGIGLEYEKVAASDVRISDFSNQLRPFARRCFELCCQQR